MADYFTEFSCIFEVGSAENAARAEDIRSALAAELDRDEEVKLGFSMKPDPAHAPGALWLHSDGFGEPEHVIRFVLACATAFDLTGRWGFPWALTCSRPRLDGFGGGAQVLDLAARCSLDWMDCAHWVAVMTDPEGKPETAIDRT